jgi:hypothetical protein
MARRHSTSWPQGFAEVSDHAVCAGLGSVPLLVFLKSWGPSEVFLGADVRLAIVRWVCETQRAQSGHLAFLRRSWGSVPQGGCTTRGSRVGLRDERAQSKHAGCAASGHIASGHQREPRTVPLLTFLKRSR